MSRKFITLLLALASVVSLKAQEQAPQQSQVRPMSRAEYVEKYKSIAIDHMRRFGIPASITMAQGILESGAGNSHLARTSNNHFGIKCKKNWTGAKVYHDDDAKGECFRAYPSVEASYEDHAKFLDESPRYDSLFAYPSNDYRSWARGLKACGYATAPHYAEGLVKIIEDMKLYLLDEEGMKKEHGSKSGGAVATTDSNETPKPEATSHAQEVKPTEANRKSKKAEKAEKADKSKSVEKPKEAASTSKTVKKELPAPQPVSTEDSSVAMSDEHVNPNNFRVTVNSHKGYNVYRSNETFYVVAKKGDSFESIGKVFNISPNMLRRFNDVAKGEQLSKSDIVYIEPKQTQWHGNKMQHVVTKGENLYSISQLYGIKMKSLCKLNKIAKGGDVKRGDIVQLQ